MSAAVPRTAPTLGELAPAGVDPVRDPDAVLAHLRRLGPVHRVHVPESGDAWLVVGRDEARAALTDPALRNDIRHSATWSHDGGNALGRNMLQTDPPDHTRLRSLVSRHFTPARIAALEPRVREIAEELAAALPRRGTADLVADYALPLPVAVIGELLGVPGEDRAALRDWSYQLLTPDSAEAAGAAMGAMGTYFAELLARKRERPGDDLLSALAAPGAGDASGGGDALTADELLGMCFLLLVAGHETTVHLISGALYALLCRPGELAALRAEPSSVGRVVEETLRLHAPVTTTAFRFAAEATRIGGTVVGAGDSVLVSLAAVGRDPGRFAEPGRFDPGRFDPGGPGRGHLAFGHGVHHCLGAPLARMEAGVALTVLAARRPAVRLAAGPGTLRWRASALTRGLAELPVHVG
ncbi:cytochrome P450 [Streptomyces uncialis]|uniref:cytochrome P450 family protein n=1 Tax=Streptomyces uncialis TaxID=1048205 RepID=UPI002E30BF63|nr:cytochrome P450 [Streptomyces uncialis]